MTGRNPTSGLSLAQYSYIAAHATNSLTFMLPARLVVEASGLGALLGIRRTLKKRLDFLTMLLDKPFI